LHGISQAGQDCVPASMRVRASARAERSAKEAYGCVVACARRLGLCPRNVTTIYLLGFVDWRGGEARNGRRSLWPEGPRRRLIKRLEGLGFKVTLERLPHAA